MKYFQNTLSEKRIKEMDICDRPRERMQTVGADALSDAELLAILIGSGSKENPVGKVAHELLTLIDTKPTIEYEDFKQVKGLGPAKGAIIFAALELGRRRLPLKRRQISQPGDIYPLIRHYADRQQEHFIVTSLNGAHEIISIHVASVGTINRTLVHPREVFAPAIEQRAVAILVAHNHPSNINGGEITPSAEDLDVTRRLKQVGGILGIAVIDHMIIGGEGYYSMLEHEVL
ncbi:DNA repair protein RadC [uncultured Sphaerochaeta sp.]|uniref:RadC family protein n=1 Tax=uncultured Sphaerochaeta sp. TaxID=886478 RepID=UPI002A0A7629|nr:DNA repair protein RadC [uncultured Sphaerochaeta sp.]